MLSQYPAAVRAYEQTKEKELPKILQNTVYTPLELEVLVKALVSSDRVFDKIVLEVL